MKFYLGIDIGKHTHVACLTDEKGTVLGKPLAFTVAASGFHQLQMFLNNYIDHKDHLSVHAGMEATGHYWLTVFAQLKEWQIPVTVLNPLEIKAFRHEGIRGNKTDAIDALKIAKVIRFGDYPLTDLPGEELIALKQLVRLRKDLVAMITQLKQKVIALLDIVFPEYQQLFSDIFGVTSFELLSQAATPEAVAQLPTSDLIALLRTASRGRMKADKATQIQQVARTTIGLKVGLDAFSLSLELLLAQIEQLQNQVDRLETEIAKLAKPFDTTLTTIPGIGTLTNAVILAEVGDVSRFNGKDGAEKLVAFAGLDPRLKESGQFKGKTKMSKRGSGVLRHAIRQAAFSAVTVAKDPMFTRIYERQLKKGKHMEVALSHVSRKMLHVIYALLKSKKSYKPILQT